MRTVAVPVCTPLSRTARATSSVISQVPLPRVRMENSAECACICGRRPTEARGTPRLPVFLASRDEVHKAPPEQDAEHQCGGDDEVQHLRGAASIVRRDVKPTFNEVHNCFLRVRFCGGSLLAPWLTEA